MRFSSTKLKIVPLIMAVVAALSTSSSDAASKLSSSASVVRAAYSDLLKRQPTASETAAELKSVPVVTASTVRQVYMDVLCSPEFVALFRKTDKTQRLELLYNRILQRPGDDGAKKIWQKRLDTMALDGVPNVFYLILYSSEFLAIHGLVPPAQFVPQSKYDFEFLTVQITDAPLDKKLVIDSARKAINRGADDGPLLLALAMQLGPRTPESFSLLDRAAQKEPKWDLPPLRKAEFYQMIGQTQRALESATIAIKLDPNNKQTQRLFAQLTRLSNEVAQAQQTLVRAVNFKDRIGKTYFELLNRAVSLAPNLPQAYVARSNYYSSVKKYSEALADAEKAIKLNARSAEAQEAGLQCCFEAGKYSDALKYAHNLVVLQPDNLIGYDVGGQCMHRLNQNSEAIQLWTAGIKSIRPAPLVLYERRGGCYLDISRNDLAVLDFTKVLDEQPKNYAIIAQRAQALFGTEQYSRAQADINSALKAGYRTPSLQFTQAQLDFVEGKISKSIENAKIGIELDRPRMNVDMHVFLIRLYLQQGKMPEAIAACDEVIKKAERNETASVLKATALSRQGKLTEAVDACTFVIKNRPKKTEAYAMRAKLYDQLGKPELAKKDREASTALGHQFEEL